MSLNFGPTKPLRTTSATPSIPIVISLVDSKRTIRRIANVKNKFVDDRSDVKLFTNKDENEMKNVLKMKDIHEIIN